MAEKHGFSFANISDHFHPWTDTQGQSPFVWAVIGGIAHATEQLELGTWVTCPTMRMHPAIVAHAAATAAAMMEGRFFLGVGTGENLNDHILGAGWPETEVRQERLEEAIAIIRLLWEAFRCAFFARARTTRCLALRFWPFDDAAHGPEPRLRSWCRPEFCVAFFSRFTIESPSLTS